MAKFDRHLFYAAQLTSLNVSKINLTPFRADVLFTPATCAAKFILALKSVLNSARRGFCRSNLTRAKFKEKFEKDHSRLRNRAKFTPYPNNFKERQCRAILVYRHTA